MQSEVAQERDVAIGSGVFGGEEFVTEKDGVRPRKKAECLAFARDSGATSGETHPRFRKCNSRHCDQFHKLKNVHRWLISERRPRHCHQTIDRHTFRGRIEIAQDLDHSQTIDDRFSHADDPAAANRHSTFLDGGDRIQPIGKCVGADDFGVKLRRGVEIMIVSGDTGGLEFVRFHGTDLAERDTDFHTELAHGPNGLQHLLEF